MTETCPICGKSFEPNHAQFRAKNGGRKIYCSPKCSAKARYVKPINKKFDGEIFTLDMENWQWKRENRGN